MIGLVGSSLRCRPRGGRVSKDDLGRTAGAAPDVTVALCTWNGARWLPEMLASLVDQVRRPDEVVIYDDASTDATLGLLERFVVEAPFPVRLTVNDRQLGSTSNFEQALLGSRGRIVALADQDDRWYPNKLERLVQVLDDDPIVTLAFSDADLLTADGRPTGQRLWASRGIDRYLRAHEIVPSEMFARRALSTGCTMAARRRAVDAALPFPDSLDHPIAPLRHDRWLALVASAVGTVQAVPEPLLGFRVHADQQTGVLSPLELRRRRLAAARAAVGAPDAGYDPTIEHVVRARQLEAAADRAAELGDFEEADRLREIARHHRVRADVDRDLDGRLRTLAAEVRRGGYDRSLLGAGAAAADIARALRRAAAR